MKSESDERRSVFFWAIRWTLSHCATAKAKATRGQTRTITEWRAMPLLKLRQANESEERLLALFLILLMLQEGFQSQTERISLLFPEVLSIIGLLLLLSWKVRDCWMKANMISSSSILLPLVNECAIIGLCLRNKQKRVVIFMTTLSHLSSTGNCYWTINLWT